MNPTYFNFTTEKENDIVKKRKDMIKFFVLKGSNMSFSLEKRERIKKYILEKVEGKQANIVKKTATAFNISSNTVYRYIKELERDNIIKKSERYIKFVEKQKLFRLYRSRGELLEEDKIYVKCIEQYLKKLPDNVQQIWEYSFTEMMNNAIDHSGADKVDIMIFQNYIKTTILIDDNGIGIFRKIKEYYNYKSLDDAVSELFKGKLTTDSKNHLGEGIFFTSRILDGFVVLSDGKLFTHDKYCEMFNDLKNIEPLKKWKDREGTIILMELSNFSNKVLKEVFDMFSDVDGGFTKTHIPLKNIFDTYPVSRSQAKRLCQRFDKFAQVELDFQGVDEIGQGFAHEIFVVFQRNHPNVELIPVNMTDEVKKMISHVKKTSL